MFQPGISGNPRGRPKGSCSGRAQTIAALDAPPPDSHDDWQPLDRQTHSLPPAS